ncbi:MAG: FtsW/RodA/SpoVE family cell cycle protein, partial [Acidobacteriota bacterium]
MNRKIPYDQGLITIILALLGFGLIMVFSASTLVSRELYGSQTAIFTRQLIAMVLGMMALLVTMKIDYHLYQRRTVVFLLLGLSVLLLGFLLLTPGSAPGARRWVRLGPVNFQPSELAKLAVIVFTSGYLVWKKEHLNSLSRGLLPYLAVVG